MFVGRGRKIYEFPHTRSSPLWTNIFAQQSLLLRPAPFLPYAPAILSDKPPPPPSGNNNKGDGEGGGGLFFPTARDSNAPVRAHALFSSISSVVKEIANSIAFSLKFSFLLTVFEEDCIECSLSCPALYSRASW